MPFAVKIILIIIGSYLVGNINAAVLISKLRGEDIRKKGSGNAGSMNMVRNYGKLIGILTLVIDALKATVCCIAALAVLGENPVPYVTDDKLGAYIAGLSVTVGHIYPIFMKFKGGKGVACIIGIMVLVNPIAIGAAFVLGILVIIFTHIGTFGTFLMVLLPLIVEAVMTGAGNLPVSILILALAVLSLFAHRENIVRLFKGKENRTFFFSKQKQRFEKKNNENAP